MGAKAGLVCLPVVGFALFQLHWPPQFWVLAAVIAAVLLVALAQPRLAPGPAGATPEVRRRWKRITIASIFVTGLAWGALSPVFMTPDAERVAVLLCMVMALMFSVSTSTAGYLPAAYAFNLPMALLFIVPAALQPAPFGRVAALTVLIMLGLVLGYAHKIHHVIVDSIRMRFENRDLNEALTEQKVQERTRVLEAANRHKSEFLASMSHELRTPLNAIIGYSEMLQEDAADQGAEAMLPDLRKINSAGKQLLEMINSVLDLSKIEAGRMELHLETSSCATWWPSCRQ